MDINTRTPCPSRPSISPFPLSSPTASNVLLPSPPHIHLTLHLTIESVGSYIPISLHYAVWELKVVQAQALRGGSRDEEALHTLDQEAV